MLKQKLTVVCNKMEQNYSFQPTLSNPDLELLSEKVKFPRAKDRAAIKGSWEAVNFVCIPGCGMSSYLTVYR